jgi:hypothetical protein
MTLRSLPWRISVCAVLLFGAIENSSAQQTMGAASLGMGQTGVSQPDNPWAVFSNPALLSTNQSQISLYGFRYVGFTELTDMVASASAPVGSFSVGAGAHRYGFELFQESRFNLSAKHRLDRFHYGMSLSLNHIRQGGNYGSASAIGVNAGVAAQLFSELWFGARATNLNYPAYDGSEEELPRELVAGITYRPAASTELSGEIVKDVSFPASFRGGIQIELISGFFVRSGVTTNPETWSAGFGYLTSLFAVNVAVQQHNLLGLSPGVDLTLHL